VFPTKNVLQQRVHTFAEKDYVNDSLPAVYHSVYRRAARP